MVWPFTKPSPPPPIDPARAALLAKRKRAADVQRDIIFNKFKYDTKSLDQVKAAQSAEQARIAAKATADEEAAYKAMEDPQKRIDFLTPLIEIAKKEETASWNVIPRLRMSKVKEWEQFANQPGIANMNNIQLKMNLEAYLNKEKEKVGGRRRGRGKKKTLRRKSRRSVRRTRKY